MMTAWHSPQSIYALGHRAIKGLFDVPVQIQEKVDGSFFAFGYFPELATDGEATIRIRSKGAVMILDAPEKMFNLGAKAVKDRQDLLHPGWQYRGEFLAKPKHNSLAYDRAPKDNIILFDVCTSEEEYLSYSELVAEGERIGLEVVPQLGVGQFSDAATLRSFLDNTSVLGGQKVEGIVIKPLVPLFGLDKKLLMGKFVSEAFKEVHSREWKLNNPSHKDIVEQVVADFTTAARWTKARLHLRERGLLTDSPKDIPLVIKEVQADILKEEVEVIKERLFVHAKPSIMRGVVRGLPEWVKEQLLKEQFEMVPNGE